MNLILMKKADFKKGFPFIFLQQHNIQNTKLLILSKAEILNQNSSLLLEMFLKTRFGLKC